MYVRARALGGAALLLVLVAGCDGEEDPPNPSPPSSSTPSSATSSETVVVTSGPVEPVPPPETVEDSKAGAEAFVRYYWDVVNFATKSGETEALSRLDQPSCDTCRAGIAGVKRVYDAGGEIVGGKYRVTRLETARSASGRWTVIAYTHVGEQRAVGAGELDRIYPAGRDKWLIALTRIEDRWSVTTLESL